MLRKRRARRPKKPPPAVRAASCAAWLKAGASPNTIARPVQRIGRNHTLPRTASMNASRSPPARAHARPRPSSPQPWSTGACRPPRAASAGTGSRRNAPARGAGARVKPAASPSRLIKGVVFIGMPEARKIVVHRRRQNSLRRAARAPTRLPLRLESGAPSSPTTSAMWA